MLLSILLYCTVYYSGTAAAPAPTAPPSLPLLAGGPAGQDHLNGAAVGGLGLPPPSLASSSTGREPLGRGDASGDSVCQKGTALPS